MVVSDNHRACVVFRYLPGYKNRIENIQKHNQAEIYGTAVGKKKRQW